ncbi:hypothetical protein Nepgr_001306 [Nepenthes gracilis]|uniref:Uncharacterized protein n=1 Tax=Nepenthes gracilis TaxID=150966 RepID=A0AAD3P8B8_NEPGR|nr:hypothetical protein Nepgr_001306 [Nepenthes gracilis]
MQNQSDETTLYVAAECGYVDIVKELIKRYDVGSAAIKAKNGYDSFHVAAKQWEFSYYACARLVTKCLATVLLENIPRNMAAS